MCFRPSTGAPFILDYEKKNRREAKIEDAETIVTIVDALDGYDIVNSVISPPDAPASAKNLLRFIASHRYSLKPSDLTVSLPQEVKTAAEIAARIRGSEKTLREKPLTALNISMVSPLRCTEHESNAMIETAKAGLPIEILSSPSLGLTGPVTIAGSVAVSLAETIGAIYLIYLIEPGLGVIMCSRVVPIELRTLATNYGAPELGMASVLIGEYCARYHIPTNLYGFGTCAKFVSAQSEMERMISGTTMALAQPNVITGSGFLDNGLLVCPEQLIIDHEAIRFLKRLREPIEINEDSIAVDVLKKGMAQGSLIAEEHTLEHMKKGAIIGCGLNQWNNSIQNWEDNQKHDMFERAHKKLTEILAGHRAEPFDTKLEEELNRIVKDAEAQW
jgi:trimethylamine--corrinoid protein Co-methyltransferase